MPRVILAATMQVMFLGRGCDAFVRLIGLGWLILSACSACDRQPGEPQSSSPSELESSERTSGDPSASGERPATPPRSPGDAKSLQGRGSAVAPATARDVPSFDESSFPGAERIVAIGDLHGDFAATERVFRLAGAIDAAGHWSGGELVVVQTGDQLDRGDGEARILSFLDRLQDEAEAAGGRVIVLNGNHETMNVLGDFRYVTPGALDAFEAAPASARARNVTGPYARRARTFLPGGGMAMKLAERPLIVKVGETVFAHGGVLPSHVQSGVDRLNRQSADWMRGERATPPQLVLSPDGPLWTRLYGEPQLGASACSTLAETLRLMDAKRLVVGHTVQQRGLSSACDDRVYRIDVGLSSYYGDRPVQALELRGDEVRILTDEVE